MENSEIKPSLDNLQDGNETKSEESSAQNDGISSNEPESASEIKDEIPFETLSENENSLDSTKDDELVLYDDNIAQDEVNEAYNNIMNVCSTAAEAIKKTIVEVLNTRSEKASLSNNDSANELENSLREKIADFENLVSGSYQDKELATEYNITNKNNTFHEVDKEISNTPADNAPDAKEEIKESDNSIESKVGEEISNKSLADQNKKAVDPSKVQASESILPLTEEEKYLKKVKGNTNKKKGEKTLDLILKSLSNCSTTEEKFQLLAKKHVEALEELKLNEPRLKQYERQIINLSREKEQLQTEHNRIILAKSRLESLCRELQKQNKEVKEESLLRIREEEEKRKEVATKFQATLNDISALMQENSKKNAQLREENTELAKKLKALVDHYETWERHMEKVVQQKDLEAQLAKAKCAKTNLLLKQETEKFLKEKHFLLENMSELQKKCTTLATNELQLRTELGDYTSKYEEFQAVLNKSSQVFASFKNDMDTTSKKIKKLEKQTNVYKQKWESSNNALLKMINDKQKHDEELMNAQQRVQTLEKLCRALQGERNDLQNQIKALSTGNEKEHVPSVETKNET